MKRTQIHPHFAHYLILQQRKKQQHFKYIMGRFHKPIRAAAKDHPGPYLNVLIYSCKNTSC